MPWCASECEGTCEPWDIAFHIYVWCTFMSRRSLTFTLNYIRTAVVNALHVLICVFSQRYLHVSQLTATEGNCG